MSTREDLAQIINKALGDVTGIYDTSDDEDLGVADAILAAGYGKLADAWDEASDPEAIEAAAKASYEEANYGHPWEHAAEEWKAFYRSVAAAALEAAAPYLVREARAVELEAAAEHEASRSQTFMNTMEHMVESREYGHDDILRYGAYSAEAQTSAYRLRARAAAIRAGGF